jgi:hypothetical protein
LSYIVKYCQGEEKRGERERERERERGGGGRREKGRKEGREEKKSWQTIISNYKAGTRY